MRWRRRSILLFGLVAASALGAGMETSCVDLESLGDGPPDSAIVQPNGDGGDSGATNDDPCGHESLVASPAVDDSPGEVLPTFEIAVDQVVLDPTKARGLDLDGVCTCDTRPLTRGDGGPSCAHRQTLCDLDGGVDNAIGLVAQASSPIFAIDAVPNRLLASGTRGLLLQLAKYNGRANDQEVVVGALLAEGIRTQGCPTSVKDDATGFYSPGRCGDDEWTLSASTVVSSGSGSLPVVIGTGWVNDYRLAVRFGNPVTLPFSASNSVTFASAMLTGRIVPLGEDLAPRNPPSRPPTIKERRLYRIDDGVLVGRVGSVELLNTVGSYNSATGPLCRSQAFDLVRTRICESLDVQRDVSSMPDPTLPCDALSAAFGFTAAPAKSAGVTTLPLPADPCADEADAGTLFACPR